MGIEGAWSNQIQQLVIVVGPGPPSGGVYVYDSTGHLIGSVASADGTGPLGGTVRRTISSYSDGGAYVTLDENTITVGNTVNDAGFEISGGGGSATFDSGVVGGQPSDLPSIIQMVSKVQSVGGNQPQVVIASTGANPVSGALFEVDGQAEVITGLATGRLFAVVNTASSTSVPAVEFEGLTAGDFIIGIMVTGDSFNRVKIDTNGKIAIGSGAATPDTNLYRGAANLLQTDDSMAFTDSSAIAAQAGAAILTAANGQMQSVNSSGLNYNLTVGQPANFNKNTVTGASFANLSTFTIPASDALVVGATYTFDIFGYGQWGNPATQLNLEATIGGATFALTGIAAGAFAASAVFQWNARLTVCCSATGAGGTWRCSLSGAIQQTGNALSPGTAADNSVSFSLGEGSAADISGPTTGSLAVQLLAEWAAAGNGSTITKSVSYPARVA